MTPYKCTRREASDFLTIQLEMLMADINSPNAILRALSKDALPKVETVLQWLDTQEGNPPTDLIIACLGNVTILDEEADYKEIIIR